ncbi:arginine decarboxylase, pyruvoyl-dependent [Methanobrevibacter sp. OttesenSCG-928-K11]|nr:arginine decarboxylase, pyruvoyl-dependent [Methanobrevibacter sp. OttesenSCG-928-K11]MDL2270939.1 arginine decarboxylase, pyruvoyl-dependent [Methanobrevibacter sp. OttesenSCG-928-I08]
MKIAIVSGKDEGPSKLNAFDNALLKAGIGDVNLITVSSMLKKETQVVELPELEKGSMVNCVLSTLTSDKKGEKITSSIAVAIGENLGCVVENSKVNCKSEDVVNEAIEMVKYMMNKREEPIKELIAKEETHIVENIGSVVASVVYLEE